MSGCMRSVEDVSRSIERGDALLLAGDAGLLAQLPTGNWIGGSIPYLVTDGGGAVARDMLHVTELPDFVTGVSIKVYDSTTIREVYSDVASRDFGVIIIPASCPTHLEFALHAPGYREFAVRPLVGWISGVHLDELGRSRPSVFCGTTGELVEDGAVVMHATLPATRVADVRVVNIFEQGDGEKISFPADGFDVRSAWVDGVETNFAEYIRREGLDTRVPLVADFYGVMVNVSFQAVDLDNRAVRFYSPVFAGLTYRHAKPVENYSRHLLAHLPQDSPQEMVFSCNCVLNYFYAEPEGRWTQGITGPLTFGEVAYQLLNQTMVYLTITDLSAQGHERVG